MNAEDREQLRLSLLRFLDANATKFSLPTGLLLQMAISEGRRGLKRAEVEAELTYLEDKGLAKPINKLLSPELQCWRITAAGRDHYAQLTGD